MYYKIKVNKENLEIVSKVKRARLNDGFLYCTQDEIEKLNPEAIKNYELVNHMEEKINEK